MRRDILSAYAASISRVMSWVIVSAIVYRRSPEAFAMLALVRGTIGILNYVALGLLPAMIRTLAARPKTAIASGPVAPIPVNPIEEPIQLEYFTSRNIVYEDDADPVEPNDHDQKTYSTGVAIASISALIGVVATGIAAAYATKFYSIPVDLSSDDVQILIIGMGLGIALRWFTEPSAALLQTNHRIAMDNMILIATEFVWVLLVVIKFQTPPVPAYPRGPYDELSWIGAAYLAAGLVTLMGRSVAPSVLKIRYWALPDASLFRPLLATGLLITLAQLADYLYSPTDYLLINHLLAPLDLTHYAPAVQIDSGLLLLVTALGSVLLPKTALAHAAGDRAIVRTYYLRGTVASAVTLLTASLVIYFASPFIFRVWFGNAMPGTVAILPLVLLNTVIGGSSAVGRAILIGIGKTKPFAVSVLMAGVTNVIFSVIFVKYFQMGLKGIILGTVVAVVVRCGIWMPWYVLRELDRDAAV